MADSNDPSGTLLAEVVQSESELSAARAKITTWAGRSPAARRTILTKGTFDILHSGHLALFAYCARLKAEDGVAEVLVVVESDASVRARKGFDRPFQDEKARSLQIALLKNVDHVLVAPFTDLSTLIVAIQPSVYVKGMDTALASEPTDVGTVELNPVRNPELTALPPEARVIVFVDDGSVSTTAIVKRIKASESG